MTEERLYELAFAFKATKLWKKIWDTQLFAVEHSDGTIGYCCVVGMLNDEISLTVYPEEGISFLCDNERIPEDIRPWEHHELAMSRNGVCCSFRCKDEMPPDSADAARKYAKTHGIALRGMNSIPCLERLRPHSVPWYLEDAQDRRRLAEGLEAALEVARRLQEESAAQLGLHDGKPWDRSIPLLQRSGDAFIWRAHPIPAAKKQPLPSPRVGDELLLARVRKANRTAAWNCAVMMHPNAMVEHELKPGERPKHAPRFPMVLIMQDTEEGTVLNANMAYDYLRDAHVLCAELLKAMAEHGRPAAICVRDQRTHALLSTAAGQVGVKVETRKSIPMLDDALKEFYRHFDGPGAWDDDDDDAPEGSARQKLRRMLRNRHFLPELPDEVLISLMHEMVEAPLPAEETLMIVDEWIKRFLK